MRIANNLYSPLLLALLLGLSTQDCRTDSRCTQCDLLLFYTALGNYYMYFCNDCAPNSSTDLITNLCTCHPSYYSSSPSKCSSCGDGCASCTNPNSCIKCSSELNWELSRGKCVCKNGYEHKGSGTCTQKPNVVMIVLSTVGSLLCMVVGAVLCAVVRMRRGAHQVHAEKKNRRRNSNNAQIQIYEGYESAEMGDNTSNMFWNTKSFEYKADEICSICLDSNPLFITECGHYFHDRCIYSWLDTKTSCPNCNTEIQSKDIRRWCCKCRKVLMPVIRNVVIKRIGKKKKELVQSNPIENQQCEACDNEDSKSMSQDLEDLPHEKQMIK